MKKLILNLLIISNIILANEIPLTPIIPGTPIQKDGNKKRILLETGALRVKTIAKVVVPLEVISDVEIDRIVFDNEEVKIPFELELNKIPELNKKYKVNFSETEIDIDKDGKIDTIIYVNDIGNTKVIRDNHVKIMGRNISKEGTHKKKIYITVEVNE